MVFYLDIFNYFINCKNYLSHCTKLGESKWENAMNIAAGNRDVYGTLNSWLKSTGHCQNLMTQT